MRGSRRLALVGVCLALAAGCGDNLKPGGGGAPTGPTGPTGTQPGVAAWIRFAPDVDTARGGGFQDAFELYKQRDVLAVIAVPDGAGVRKMRLDFTGPADELHYSSYVAFSTQTAPPSVSVVAETGAEVPVEKAERILGRARVILPIPITGTNFTRYGLAGRHTVTVYVDDSTTPVVSGSFELRGAP